MWPFRWLPTITRCVLCVLQAAPAAALLVAVLVDEGPTGEARVSAHLFSVVLWLFDDFAWTCARNSVVFALLVSVASLVLGVGLRCALARLASWGRLVLGGAVMALVASSPAFLALGITGLLGVPQRWPWPFAAVDPAGPGVSLESWSGLPLWLIWVWSTLPAGAALVALATESSFRRLNPSWDLAARLAGASTYRIVRDLSWPIVRPAAARAAGLVFLLAVVEPGGPLILGLRRTLAFQIVDAATGPSPFPRTAVWALMAGLLGLAGWLAFRWKGGSPILLEPVAHTPAPKFGLYPRRVSPTISIVSAGLLGIWVFVVWLPILGLTREAIGNGRVGSTTRAAAIDGFLSPIALFGDPLLARVLLDSALFGLAVAGGIMVLAWAAGLESQPRSSRRWSRRLRPIAELPPLVLGTGVLTLPWLAGLASRFLLDREQSSAAVLVGDLAAATDPREHAWTMMGCCVGLVLLPRFFRNKTAALAPEGRRSQIDSCHDAALLAGAVPWRAWALRKPGRLGRLAGRFGLVCAFAATNLTPSLLFSLGTDRKTLGPAFLELAGGDALARSQAAVLALAAVLVNLAAIAAARGARALPLEGDLV